VLASSYNLFRNRATKKKNNKLSIEKKKKGKYLYSLELKTVIPTSLKNIFIVKKGSTHNHQCDMALHEAREYPYKSSLLACCNQRQIMQSDREM